MVTVERRYHITHLNDERKAKEILKEIRETPGLEMAELSGDYEQLTIRARDEEFSRVMDKSVNICKRISSGCELTYLFSSPG